MRKIDIGSIAGIDEAIKALNKLADLKSACKAIADVGTAVANEIYAGSGAVAETVERDDGYAVKATAENNQIAFIEFGAGSGTVPAGEFADKAPFGVYRGSYSDEHGGEYAKTGYQYWHHDGKVYTEIPANPGMEMAREAVLERAEEIVREVYHLD